MSERIVKEIKKTIDDILSYYRRPVACEKIIHLLASAKQILSEEAYRRVEGYFLERLGLEDHVRGI